MSSLTKEFKLLGEEARDDSRLGVIPLAEVVAVDEVAPFSASADSVTKSSCAADKLPLCASCASWFRSVANWFSVDGELKICDNKLLVIPLVDKAPTPLACSVH